MSYSLTHLRELEAESIFVMREVAAQFQNPALLFSGGKVHSSWCTWHEKHSGHGPSLPAGTH